MVSRTTTHGPHALHFARGLGHADTGRPSSLSVLAAAEGRRQRFPEEELLHKIPKSSQEARKVLFSEETSERTQPLVAHGSYTSPPSSPSLLSPPLSPQVQWSFYVLSLTTFHLMEFVTTALFNPRTLTWDCTSNCTPQPFHHHHPYRLVHRIHLHKRSRHPSCTPSNA